MKKKEIRKFGITLGIILAIISGVLFFKGSIIASQWLLAVSGISVLSAIFLPVLLFPVHKFMMWLSHYMGLVMTTVILSLVFYSIFTPISLLLKIVRKDLLDKGIDKRVSSYWIKGRNAEFDNARYEKLY